MKENIFTKDELISILLYFQNSEAKCGPFNITPRMKAKVLKYALKTSSNLGSDMCNHTYNALVEEHLEYGCGTKKEIDPWIQAVFDGMVHITNIQIGVLCKG